MSSLANILASERSIRKKPFRKQFVYKDDNWTSPTTVSVSNSDYSLPGPAAILRNKYKQYCNYGSGYAVIQTTRPPNPSRPDDKPFEQVAILDLDGFIMAFSETEKLAAALESSAKAVISEWASDNGGREKVGQRVPVETCRLATALARYDH